jgi:hypothetical protein
MAKRVRGSSSRPGQRARLQRGRARPATPAPSRPVAPKPTTLTPEEEARAAELEAQIMADERAAEETARRARERSRREPETVASARTGSIAERAADEYDYVLRDVRRIALIGGSLIAILIGLWLVIEVAGVGPF